MQIANASPVTSLLRILILLLTLKRQILCPPGSSAGQRRLSKVVSSLLPANGKLYKFNTKKVRPHKTDLFMDIYFSEKQEIRHSIIWEEREEFPQSAEVPPNVEVQHLVSPGTCCSPF